MGLFGFGKKKKLPRAKIDTFTHEPTKEEMQKQWKSQTAQKARNFQKDEAGLYPYEILMLSYLEKYAAGKEPARFWEREYAVDDVHTLIRSLEERGFAENGKLTEKGKEEISKNEYVLYMHQHKFTDISMSRMSILVNQNPGRNYRDLIWGEFNRLSGAYIENKRFELHGSLRFTMYRFLLEEKRYAGAFPLLSEAFFYTLNGSNSPFVPPAYIEQAQFIERKTNYRSDEISSILDKHFDGMYAPYRNFSNDEIIQIIIAYSFGSDEEAQKILSRVIF